MRTEVASAVGQVFESMSFCELSHCVCGPVKIPALSASILFWGALAGEFRLTVSQHTAERLSADFLAAEAAEIDGDPECFVAEFANVACGAVLSVVAPGADIHFSVPVRNREPEACQVTYYFSSSGEEADMAVGLSLSEPD
ncbi:MAG: hypothetical protein KGN84_15510 [Acidobacteriota bacterium]|nr:hypothetical protein [Acidobacteriota bacterium]